MTLARRLNCTPGVAGLILVATFSTAAVAQITTAEIVGVVTDASEGVMPGVTVTARSADTGATHSAVTDQDGNYQILRLAPGRYTITTELEGFKKSSTEVTLAIGDRYRLSTKLEVGSMTDTVTVKAEAPLLQTERAAVAVLVDARAMQDLPLNGRNFIRLAQLTPGATEGPPNSLSSGNRPDDRRASSSISVNGQDTSLNNFLIDGVDNNERFIGTVVIRPQVDSIQEMRVETNAFSAEMGRTAGGVINVVTKSGANAFHGSGFEFYRNERFDAPNYFARNIPKPEYNQHQLGGSLGGPLVKDKTFFFVDYAGLRLRQGNTYVSSVPTDAIKAGNFQGRNIIYDPVTGQPFPDNLIPANRIDPAARNLAALYPAAQTATATNNFVYGPTKTQEDDSFDIRVDERFDSNNTLFLRYSYNNARTFFPDSLPKVGDITPGGLSTSVFPGTSKSKPQAIQGNFARLFTAKLILELKGGFSRYDAATVPSNYGIDASTQIGIPGINVAGDGDSSGLSVINIPGFTSLGDAGFIPLVISNDLTQGAATLTYVRGAHTLKVGYDQKHRLVLAQQSPTARGQFDFSANFTSNGGAAGTGDAFASFLLGLPSATARSKYLVKPYYQTNEAATFAQYDWRARNWLTVNAGVRWDMFGEFSERDDQISNVDVAAGRIVIAGQDGTSRTAGVHNDMNNFAPRFGFAATVDPKTVVRGGYGISYVPPILAGGAFRNPPFINLLNINPAIFAPINRLSEGLPDPVATSATNPTGGLAAVDFDIQVPWNHQFNVAMQRELWGQVAATVAYVGLLGREQVVGLALNNRPLPNPATPTVQQPRPFVGVFPNIAGLSYRTNLGTQNYKSVQTVIERRFAGRWGGRVGYTWAHGTQVIPDGQFPFTSLPNATNPFPEMLSTVKFEKSNNPNDVTHRATFALNYRLGLAESAKGLVGVVAKGWQVNAVAVLQTGVPLTVTNASARSNTGGGDRPNLVGDPNLSGDQRTIGRWFNTDAYATQAIGTFGNAGLNNVRGPGAATLDLSFFKDIELQRGSRLQIRVETFNLTNRANFANPGTAFGSATFGVISAANQARNVQFAAKLLF